MANQLCEAAAEPRHVALQQELEGTSSSLRDVLATCRGQLDDLQQQRSDPGGPSRRLGPPNNPAGTAPRISEELELANAECAALREETAELETEMRELRRALDEAESTKHAHAVSHRQLTKALADAQAGIKQLLGESDAAAAAAQRAAERIAELEDGHRALLERLAAAERERAEFGDMTLHANVRPSVGT